MATRRVRTETSNCLQKPVFCEPERADIQPLSVTGITIRYGSRELWAVTAAQISRRGSLGYILRPVRPTATARPF